MLGVYVFEPFAPDNKFPLVAASYQSTTRLFPLGAAAVSVTVPVPHRALSVPVGAAGGVFIVAVTVLRLIALLPVVVEIQPVVVFRASA